MVKAKEYTIDEVLQMLKKYCDTFSTREAAAESMGVGRVFLWRVLNGNSVPTEAMLEKIGLKRERVVSYTYTGSE